MLFTILDQKFYHLFFIYFFFYLNGLNIYQRMQSVSLCPISNILFPEIGSLIQKMRQISAKTIYTICLHLLLKLKSNVDTTKNST